MELRVAYVHDNCKLLPRSSGRRKAGKLLVYDGDRYGLFHDRFKRFLVGEQEDPIAKALEAG